MLWLMAVEVLFAPVLGAQGGPVFSPTAGPDSPFADERALAGIGMTRAERLEAARAALREGTPLSRIVPAIDTVTRARDKADIALLAPCVASLDPAVSMAAMAALRAYGKEALAALEALAPEVIDAPTRKKLREQLLRDHVVACCMRDRAVNPLQLDYEARLDELDSVNVNLELLLLSLLREALPDLRKDLNGQYFNRRYYYYVVAEETEPAIIEYGALVIAALARRKPDVLKRETEGLMEKNPQQAYPNYWGQVRQSATRELACFLARNGQSAAAIKMVSDMEMTLRSQQDAGFAAGVHLDIAAAMMSGGVKDGGKPGGFSMAAGPFESGLIMEHIETALQLTGQSGMPAASLARYLKARLLVAQGDDGGALRELEESIEASDEPSLLLGVDGAFASLSSERRFQLLLQYTALIARRVDESARPYKAAGR
ncbi:hypothetical protein PLCT2_01346 [Planctomycetaceae bacterium]|nr:hypothetical protein PLCT2_01346 [Planctomycetaceae bacterium]